MFDFSPTGAIAVESRGLVDETGTWQGQPGSRERELRTHPAQKGMRPTETAAYPGQPCTVLDEGDACPDRMPVRQGEASGEVAKGRAWLAEIDAWLQRMCM